MRKAWAAARIVAVPFFGHCRARRNARHRVPCVSFELPGFPFANNLRVAAILESYAGTDPGAVSCNRGFARTRCAISSEFGVLVESYLGL